MANFDESEAESIAQNWVQNLRFRFARMGLNYSKAGLREAGVDDQERDGVEKCISNGMTTCLRKKQGISTDTLTSKTTNVKPGQSLDLSGDVSDCVSDIADQGTFISARSTVDLESLRAKRLNFFKLQRKTTSIDDRENSERSLDAINEKSRKDSQKLLNGSAEFASNDCNLKQTTVESSDLSNNSSRKQAWSNNKLDDDISTGHWSSRHSEKVAWGITNKPERIPSSTNDDHMSLGVDWWALNKLSGTNDLSVVNDLVDVNKSSVNGLSSTKKSSVNKQLANKLPLANEEQYLKEATQVFPIELDDDFSVRPLKTMQHEVLVNTLVQESDSDSDFTLDDPISRHSSPRVDNPIWEHLRHNLGTTSPLGQSLSPPAPQIAGALYHEFRYSDGSSDDETNKAHQRPRSLSHPTTGWDCLEQCSSYCCGNPDKDLDVICNVSNTKNAVEVSISYDNENIADHWLDSKQCVSKRDSTILKNAHIQSYLSNREFDNEPDSFVCPECHELSRSQSNWCLECGANLLNPEPLSSKSFDLGKDIAGNGRAIPISKSHVRVLLPEKTPEVTQHEMPKQSIVSESQSDLKSRIRQTVNSRESGRRWEKSHLAWSSYKDGNLAKPLGHGKSFKSRSRNTTKELANPSRQRASSCRNPEKRVLKDSGKQPGSLPKSYKFREVQCKKNSSNSEHGLSLKGRKAKKNCNAKSETLSNHVHVLDSNKNGNHPELIRTSRANPEPYLCLPDEIILRIFLYLSHSDLAKCACVCKQLERIARDDILWKTIVLRRIQSIKDEFLEKIGAKKPVSLSLIRCNGKSVTSAGVRELFRGCGDKLEELNFIGCNGGQLIGESVLLHVALRCNKLRSVDVSWSNVGDNGVEALVQNVERLECLCLNGCQAITDRSLKVVADRHGTSLATFEIFGCFNVSAPAIKRLGQKCPNLETLNLGQCYKITSSDIGRLVSHLVSIVNLDLRGCKQARDACVKTIVKHCPHLVNLVLANCPLITDVAMAEIASNLTTVRCLDVCGCVKVTDHGVRALARSCNRLNSLDLSSTSITQKSVMLLANYCSQNLQSLKLSFCVDVTDDSVCRLVKHCKRMKTLHLYGCKRLRNVKALQELNRSLKLEF